MSHNTKQLLFRGFIIIYAVFFLLILLARFERIFIGAYETRYAIWLVWTFLSFGLIIFGGLKSKHFLERLNISPSRKILCVFLIFIIGTKCMGIWAMLSPRISKSDIRHFLKSDYRNFEKVHLIKNDIFKQHPDIYNASYFTAIRFPNYWKIKNIVSEYLNYDLSEYDINQRLSNITRDNEIAAIVFHESEIVYYFTGFSNLILIRQDSTLKSEKNLEYIDNHYFIKETINKEEE